MGCGRAYGTNQKKGTKGTNRHRFPKTERVGRSSKTKVKSPTLARTNGARMGQPSAVPLLHFSGNRVNQDLPALLARCQLIDELTQGKLCALLIFQGRTQPDKIK
jgi:hypothetical protein